MVGDRVIEEEWLQQWAGQQEASEQSHQPRAARGQHPADRVRVGHRPAGTDLAGSLVSLARCVCVFCVAIARSGCLGCGVIVRSN